MDTVPQVTSGASSSEASLPIYTIVPSGILDRPTEYVGLASRIEPMFDGGSEGRGHKSLLGKTISDHTPH